MTGPAPHAVDCHGPSCITCSDEALPMRVLELGGDELALCEDDAGRRSTVEMGLVVPVAAGDVVLVHAGTAIARAA